MGFLFTVWTEYGKWYTVQACAEDILKFKNGLKFRTAFRQLFPRISYRLTSQPIMFEALRHNFSNKLCFELSHIHSEKIKIVLPIIGGSRQLYSLLCKCQLLTLFLLFAILLEKFFEKAPLVFFISTLVIS